MYCFFETLPHPLIVSAFRLNTAVVPEVESIQGEISKPICAKERNGIPVDTYCSIASLQSSTTATMCSGWLMWFRNVLFVTMKVIP